MTQYTLIETDEFIEWLDNLKDPIGKAGVIARLSRARNGNFGDHKPLTNANGIYEMRVFKGKGYRVYYIQHGNTVYVLLCGGDKDNQKKDVNKAKDILKNFQEIQPEHTNNED